MKNNVSLSVLFGGIGRTKILKKFLNEPDREFFIREIARECNLQIHQVRMLLSQLEQIGLLKSRETPRKKFYSLNYNSPLLKGLFLILNPNKNEETITPSASGQTDIDEPPSYEELRQATY